MDNDTSCIDVKCLEKLDEYIESIYSNSINLGERLSKVFCGDNGKSQMRNLENMVYSTKYFSEIKNFVKNQIGKDTRNTWNNNNSNNDTVGDEILKRLEELEKEAHTICSNKPEMLHIAKLRLARGWIRQVMAHYLYSLVREAEVVKK